MISKNIKVIDEHNIDRNANIMFAFELEGSGYVTYWIERDEENSNIFISKIIKNLDNTYNMLDVDDSSEKNKLNEIIKALITNSVESQADKLSGNSVTLGDGKVVKFIGVSFNKEQKFNIPKTYVTTVKKEVVRVAEKYYFVEVVVEAPKVVEDIFPTVTPVTEPVKEVFPEIPVQSTPVAASVVETPVVAPTPVVTELSVVEPVVVQSTPVAASVVEAPVVVPTPVVAEPPVVEPVVVQSTPVAASVVEAPVVAPTPVVAEPPVVEPVIVQSTPVAASVVDSAQQTLVFNAANETNLNAALGEVANNTTIPVENIQPVREFGVDAPVQPVPIVSPMPQPSVENNSVGGAVPTGKSGGFANSKFFMFVAIAFFLASCVFLGYEVFSYFQITK